MTMLGLRLVWAVVDRLSVEEEQEDESGSPSGKETGVVPAAEEESCSRGHGIPEEERQKCLVEPESFISFNFQFSKRFSGISPLRRGRSPMETRIDR
jgi:hypothetical protein